MICSPGAANSEWVNREVRHFQALGRGDRIIPFIIAGRPDTADPAQSAFLPPCAAATRPCEVSASRSLAGKGIRVSRRGHPRPEPGQALGPPPPPSTASLSQSCDRRGPLAAGCRNRRLSTWDYHRLKVDYYADYVEVRGVPQGIGKLTAHRLAVAGCRGNSSPRGGTSTALAASTAAAACFNRQTPRSPNVPSTAPSPTATTSTGIRDRVSATGKVLQKAVYTPTCRSSSSRAAAKAETGAGPIPAIRHASPQHGLRAQRQPRRKSSPGNSKNDEMGRVVRQTYLNPNGYPTSDANGICPGLQLHSGGRSPPCVTSLSAAVVSRQVGIAGKEFQYDAQGSRVRTTWMGATASRPPRPTVKHRADLRCRRQSGRRGLLGARANPACTRTAMPGSWSTTTMAISSPRPTSAWTANLACTRTAMPK